MIALPMVAKVAIVAASGLIGGGIGYKVGDVVGKRETAKQRAEHQRLVNLGLIRDTPKPKPVKTETEA